MAVEYDFYETPVPDGRKKKKRFHARVVPIGTADLDKLAHMIHQRSTLTVGEIKATIISLRDVLVESLKEGRRVRIDEIGYFEMTATCPPVRSDHEIRAESVCFKSVVFRPEKDLKLAFANTKFVRAGYKKHSVDKSMMEVDALLTDYFVKHRYITRASFEHLCCFTRTTANRRIKLLVEGGSLKKGGVYRSPIYEAVPGFYGISAVTEVQSPQTVD